MLSSDALISNIEGILESYTLEEETVEDVLRENEELKSLYLEKYNGFMKICEENEVMKKQLHDLELSNKHLINRTKFLSKNLSALILHVETAQESTKDSITEDYKQLDNFAMKSAKSEENLQKLQSQFEEQTLANQLSDVLLEISTSEEREKQLLERLEKLKNDQTCNAEYERSVALRVLIEEYRNIGNLAHIQKKIAEQEKNLHGLKDEIKNQYELLASLD